jgi:CubicO group peptidase (beta-lactamase class C family)
MMRRATKAGWTAGWPRTALGAIAAALLAACAGMADGGSAGAAADMRWPTMADVAPAHPDFTPEGLAALDARMKEAVDKGEVPGLVSLLVKDGEVAQFRVHGARAVGGAPMTEDTIFRIYSMTKPVTAVAMMQLYEQGKWRLDDPVTKYLPELANLTVMTGVDADGGLVTVPAGRAPTLLEVMTHTAGFGYGLNPNNPVDRMFAANHPMAQPDLDGLVRRTAEIPLLFQPGERWSYSIAVDLQGAIVERISGMRFGDYLEANIFAPLGMTDTGFVVPEADRGRFAEIYTWNQAEGRLAVLPDGSMGYFAANRAQSGGGGLVSTAHDYARFLEALVNDGELDGARILKPETVAMMMTNQIGDKPGVFGGLGFGFGGSVVRPGDAAKTTQQVGTWSWWGIGGTWFWLDPVNDLHFTGMIQRRGGAGPGAVEFRSESPRLVYEALRKD